MDHRADSNENKLDANLRFEQLCIARRYPSRSPRGTINPGSRPVAAAAFLLGALTLAPGQAWAVEEEQQSYECVKTTIRTTVVRTTEDGKIVFETIYWSETVCTPISA
jgi:hypothetical protein